MSKLTALVAGGIGYVLGARAGRQRYEQLRQAATRVTSNPKVQQTMQQTAQQAKEAAPVIKDKVAGAATAATSKVKHSDSGTSSTTTTPPTTTTSTVPPTTTSTTPPTTTSTTPSSPSGAPVTPPPA